LLASFLEKLKDDGVYTNDCDSNIAADVIYNVHNARFLEFIIDLTRTESQRGMLTRRDLAYVIGQTDAAGYATRL
jgi:hypothetical protein